MQQQQQRLLHLSWRGKGQEQGRGRSSFLSQRLMPACHEWQRRVSTLGPSTGNTNRHTLTPRHTPHTHTHTVADRHHLPFLLPDKIMTYETLADIRLKRQLKRQLALPCLAVACKVFLPRLPFVLAFRSGHKHAHTQAHTHTRSKCEPEHGDVADKATRLKFIGARCRCWAC